MIGSGGVALAQRSDSTSPGIQALKQLSIDDLMAIQVTSVSRTAEPYRQAAAALTVLTADDIRRSGATTVPELLRGVPGLQVARQTANSWAVSARGFSSVNSEKLLVLSDTRSIYTPLFSGVLWNAQDYLLADVERIEVIRGPGAALWGSNAVNGVINITTKNARDTHGTLVELSAGTEERASMAVRLGGETKGGVHYRVFGKYTERDDSFHATVSDDVWRLGHLGFRTDWTASAVDEFTVQGDFYRGTIGQLSPSIKIEGRPGPSGDLEADIAGGNILGRWRRTFSSTSDLQLRAYYDRTHRDDPSFTDDLHTIDLDLQHRFSPRLHHEVIWGTNYRYTSNQNHGKVIFGVRPPASEDQLFSAFLQDQVTWRDAVRITIGTKAEHNDFSGFELQPNLRAAWDITARQTIWAAISRAARIPTRLERDIFVDVTNPDGNPVVRLLGNKDFAAEEVVAYELGYRCRVSEALQLDLAAFENRYEGLASLEFAPSFVDPADGRTVIPIVNKNLTNGHARGIETQVTFSPTEKWRLLASYSYFHMKLEPRGQDLNRGDSYEGATPRHQFSLTSSLTLPHGFEFDAQFRHVGALPRMPQIITGPGIPSYHELDAQLSWRASARMRISVVGQSLLHDHHVEYGAPDSRGEVERGVYTRIAWEL